MSAELKALFESQAIELDDLAAERFEQYYTLLISENEKYNLTSITERHEVYIKHFLDSVLLNRLPYDLSGKHVIDIGTGAGFPAIPLKILYPDMKLTCLDALNKRIGFLQAVLEQLNLDEVSLIHGRAEDFGQNSVYRETYDFAVSRAVAELRILLEYVLPFVKPGGYFFAYKSLKGQQEIDDAGKALKLLNGKIIEVFSLDLPEESGHRDIIVIQKIGHLAKKYPRRAGLPKKTPL
jgi:16S rRNA (guanine527-N7)-methyltransferase